MDTWQLADIPDQAGSTHLVTGPSVGGIGFTTALELARRGARVILAGRRDEALREAEDAVRREVAGAELVRVTLDLASLESVRAAAREVADLGPLESWGLEIERRTIRVDTTMATSRERVYAAGDVVSYPGKVRLIATGFGEAARTGSESPISAAGEGGEEG